MEFVRAPAFLHRHQLARIKPSAWHDVRQRAWDDVARQCVDHWACRGLPLVVTRQPDTLAGSGNLALGLPAPIRWERRRLSLVIPLRGVLYFDEFPVADSPEFVMPRGSGRAWRTLCAELRACGAVARVHGSYGWQAISELSYVHEHSDIDLWISVGDFDQADAVAAILNAFPRARPRLDGELVFSGGHAVAWREWQAFRAGRTAKLLVKGIGGAWLTHDVVGWRASELAQVPE